MQKQAGICLLLILGLLHSSASIKVGAAETPDPGGINHDNTRDLNLEQQERRLLTTSHASAAPLKVSRHHFCAFQHHTNIMWSTEPPTAFNASVIFI